MIKKYHKKASHIRRSREMNARRSPEQILKDLGLTREGVINGITREVLASNIRTKELKA